MILTCYSSTQFCFGSLPNRALCFRTTVAGRAGTFLQTATMKSKVSSIANNKNLPLIDRIMCRVNKLENGCWQWTGSTRRNNSDSRPKMRYNGKPAVSVYRIMFELRKGVIPTGYFVCHRCDNPLCVNPDHLFIGTVQDNVNDSIAKGRFTHQKHPHHNAEQARQLGLRNTWSKGSKRPNRKRPMTTKRQLILKAVKLASALAAVRAGSEVAK